MPHGYVAPGAEAAAVAEITLTVRSELPGASDPFTIAVSHEMRVQDLRAAIFAAGGIPPALQRLSYAGKRLSDPSRSLQHYGVRYWHARFPHWPLTVTAT